MCIVCVLQVTHAFEPAWKAKVGLGSFWAASGLDQLVVSAWMRAESASALPTPHIDVLDIDEEYEWLGSPSACAVSATAWQHCVAVVGLDPARKGHALDVAIVVGHAAGK